MDDRQSLRDFLTRTPFFGGLVGDALDRVIDMLHEHEVLAQGVIVREGDPGHSMFIVHSGTLLVCKQGEPGHRLKLTRLGEGDFFGEMTLIEMQPRAATVIADTPARVFELTTQHLYRLYQDDIASYVMILQNINRELCRRLRRADIRIIELAEETHDENTQIRRYPQRR